MFGANYLLLLLNRSQKTDETDETDEDADGYTLLLVETTDFLCRRIIHLQEVRLF